MKSRLFLRATASVLAAAMFFACGAGALADASVAVRDSDNKPLQANGDSETYTYDYPDTDLRYMEIIELPEGESVGAEVHND